MILEDDCGPGLEVLDNSILIQFESSTSMWKGVISQAKPGVRPSLGLRLSIELLQAGGV